MRKRIIAVGIAIIIAVASADLVFAKDGQNTPTKGVIRVKTGREFVITLDSNITTGYRWQLTRAVDKDFLLLLGLKYITAKTKRVGAGGREEWSFKALKPGRTRVYFQYVRPWEKKTPAAKTKTVAVIIK